MLVGRVGMLVYVYFNLRALHHTAAMPSASDWEQYGEYLESLPPLADGAESLHEVFQQANESADVMEIS